MTLFSGKISFSYTAIFILLILLGFTSCQKGSYDYRPKLHTAITAGDIRAHLKYLDSNKLRNNVSGSPQEAESADYIADELQSFGLVPAGNDSTFFQEYTIQTGVKDGETGSYMVLNKRRYTSQKKEVLPLPNSTNGKIESTVVWVGYGIEAANYDDYNSVDTDGKIVLISDGTPDFIRRSDVTLDHKIEMAERHNAVAALIIRPVLKNGKTSFIPLQTFDNSPKKTQIPVLQISRNLAKSIMNAGGYDVSELEKKMQTSRKPQTQVTNVRIQVNVDLVKNRMITRNIVAMLPGNTKRKRFIVVGTFFNRTKQVNDSREKPDYGTSTAGLLEIAQYLSDKPIRNNILFAFFSGDNKARNGAGYFADNPTIEETDVSAVVGLKSFSGKTDDPSIMVTEGQNLWKKIVFLSDPDSLKFTFWADSSSTITTPFRRMKIPTISYRVSSFQNNSGQHNDISLFRHIGRLIANLDTTKTEYWFTSAKSREKASEKIPYPKLTLGLLPDYDYKGEGLRIRRVDQDRPAQMAGLEKGDIIVSLDGKKIRNILDYMKILDQMKPGEHTTIAIHRNDRKMTLNLRLKQP